MRGATIIVAASLVVGCGSGGDGEPDATDATDDTVADTAGDTEADSAEDTATDTPAETGCATDGDCDDSDPCTADVCDRDYGTCSHEAVDADGDGYPAMEVDGSECMGGTDCDDSDALAFPGSESMDCGLDRDCNGHVDGDNDGDGYDSLDCGGDDCDDADATNHPEADQDGDGYFDARCGGDDCDDSDALAFPGSMELSCDLDRDCNGETDADNDADGYDSTECGGDDCDDTREYVSPGVSEFNCNGLDDDCNGEMSITEDADQDGYANEGCVAAGAEMDCNDTDDTIHPGATEVCDDVDDDCDGEILDAPGADDDADGYLDIDCTGGDDCDDEDATNHPGADNDGDGFVDARCGGDDCDDFDDDTYPGAPELCPDGIDQDCDTVSDCHHNEECGTFGECEIPFETIPAGTFTMGSPTSEPGRNAAREVEHEVTLTGSFEIMAYEVTQGQFLALMGYNLSHFASCGSGCPVERVTWHEAAAFANALSTDAGHSECYTCSGSGTGVACEPSATYATPYDCPGYRLPTEAEWEYAARAGTTGGTYNGTSTLTVCESPNAVLDPIAWFCGNSGVSYAGCADISGFGCCTCAGTHPVGDKDMNAWGLYDMLGNVLEWCHDWYVEVLGDGAVTDPWGPVTGSDRVGRGGAWRYGARDARAADRGDFDPGSRYTVIGLRLARSLP